MESTGSQRTDRLNRRNGTNHNKQAIRLEPTAGESPPPIKNITQTQSRVKGMILKLGIFFVAVGLVKLLVALIVRSKEKRGRA